jgi:hypothetical protein
MTQPPSDRSSIRKARYKYAIDLGFSAKEARRFRDLSGANVEKRVVRERLRITRKRPTRRSLEEQERLDRIIETHARNPIEVRQRRVFSQSERQEMFNTWTGDRNFPAWALERIRAYNTAKGENPLDSFGYRRFYFWYVLRIADFENEFYADRNDSEIRRKEGESLKAKTPARLAS